MPADVRAASASKRSKRQYAETANPDALIEAPPGRAHDRCQGIHPLEPCPVYVIPPGGWTRPHGATPRAHSKFNHRPPSGRHLSKRIVSQGLKSLATLARPPGEISTFAGFRPPIRFEVLSFRRFDVSAFRRFEVSAFNLLSPLRRSVALCLRAFVPSWLCGFVPVRPPRQSGSSLLQW